MSDRREDILVRLEAILTAVAGLSARRMTADVRKGDRPCAVLMDGDEEAREDSVEIEVSNGIDMTPQIALFVASPAELNPLRLAIVKAIAGDAALKGLCHSLPRRPGRRYLGCATQVQRGEAIEADMVLSFQFSYLLQPLKI
jgi:hypothetical protein